MGRTELKAAGRELVVASRLADGTVERRLHGEVIELTKLSLAEDVRPTGLDDRIETLRDLAPDAGAGGEHVERALDHVETARETVQ
ncbi:hypothetical protein ACFPYI_06745 [Halomarina salina]|uniref:Uncharacterized protein n=1 Tax=Halomarina salina TaxID=1872699 RepID=A0ABD5RLG1_9EURY|nr:hypothetical protein [Halomarina salina]